MKIIKVKHYKNVFEYQEIMTVIDSSGNYPLSGDEGVFFSTVNNLGLLKMIDGKPSKENPLNHVFEINGLFAIYNENMKCLTEKHETIFELLHEIEKNIMDIHEFEYELDK